MDYVNASVKCLSLFFELSELNYSAENNSGQQHENERNRLST